MANSRRKTVIKLKGRNYPTVLRVSIEFPVYKPTKATSNGHSRNSLSTFFASSAKNTYNDNNFSISYGLSPFVAVLLVDFVHFLGCFIPRPRPLVLAWLGDIFKNFLPVSNYDSIISREIHSAIVTSFGFTFCAACTALSERLEQAKNNLRCKYAVT